MILGIVEPSSNRLKLISFAAFSVFFLEKTKQMAGKLSVFCKCLIRLFNTNCLDLEESLFLNFLSFKSKDIEFSSDC